MEEVFRLPAPDAAVFKLNLGLETAIWSPVSDNVSSVQIVDPRDELECELLEARVLASVESVQILGVHGLVERLRAVGAA